MLADAGLVASNGAVGTSADNAAMESFFGVLKNNIFPDRGMWDTREELSALLITWVRRRYNHTRLQRQLGRRSPYEVERDFIASITTANAEEAA